MLGDDEVAGEDPYEEFLVGDFFPGDSDVAIDDLERAKSGWMFFSVTYATPGRMVNVPDLTRTFRSSDLVIHEHEVIVVQAEPQTVVVQLSPPARNAKR